VGSLPAAVTQDHTLNDYERDSMHIRKSRLLLGAAVPALAVVLAVGAVAFACTTYQGKLTITSSGVSSISQGDNNCGHTGGCGAPNGSMTYCGTPTLAASVPHASGGTVTVAMGTTTNCSPSQNHLAGNVTYDINLRNVDAMSSGDLVIDNPEDCMTWNASGNINLTTALADANGAFSKSVSLPSGTANTTGWYSGLCVSSHDSNYGNQGGIRYA